ncbi:transcription elongation factor 1 homolog [Phoenix dactylifera]|nr:transcription elongation factor 1 homolog isoform X2 [Phoenix dactylifera]XP_008813834.1 transcription elongation factor 1 homolog isoform X2 [Phoenix dactylifera]XP_038971578.1 transcription elongation factor 1 homolog [Phoenix dactylifera]XP_038976753.1 transcription elongation factor 1 homolog [Phoenix dactylifera]XP_038976754.1 transcription elongation factor 1 homolog [Phoenix dactylifera]XP_038976755.1 transcription elongation factor 1 homolog [Phoenix dactylifera]
MGKRKTRPKVVPKKPQPKLDVSFTCPFCNHDKSIDCSMDMKLKTGEAYCRACKAIYITSINHLTEPIDIYSEWLDECERVNGSEDNSRKRPRIA